MSVLRYAGQDTDLWVTMVNAVDVRTEWNRHLLRKNKINYKKKMRPSVLSDCILSDLGRRCPILEDYLS